MAHNAAMTVPIHYDELSRRLYANDASMYEELPAGVAFPAAERDVVELVRQAAAQGVPITARAAGTSLAGQATGGGIILDTARHLHRILALDPEQASARVEPGVIRDALNRAAAPHGLHFAPDTSTTNRCMLGGMIGNNSAGLYSVRHGTTRDHVRRIRAVLADGSVAAFGPLTPAELAAKRKAPGAEGRIYRGMLELLERHGPLVRDRFPHPDIVRRNTGYALDRLLAMEPFTAGGPPFNLAELLCGSEGTLALTVEAEVRLTPLPARRVLLVPHFASLNDALEAVTDAVEQGAAAVELLDAMVLDATVGHPGQQRNRFFLQGEPEALLLIEWHGEETAGLTARATELAAHYGARRKATAAPVFTAAADRQRVWELRKAGLGLLMSQWGELKTPEFMEDTAVRVTDLPAYVRDVQALMERYHTRCVYYGHASVGELHLRPELPMGSPAGMATLQAMALEVADLIRSYRGSLSGEHGDGRLRAPLIERVMGREVVDLLEQVKRLWDPDDRLNPGKIVRAAPMDQALRPPSSPPPPGTGLVFHWRDQNGFAAALDRCNGAGACVQAAESGEVLCPSYQATRDEKDSTRGRANLFRQLFRTQQAAAFASDDLAEALNCCLSCKACQSECPARVDMARMKAEFLHGRHQQLGSSPADRFFARPERWLGWGGRLPGAANAVLRSPLVRRLMQARYGIHPARSLPPLAAHSFGAARRRRTPRHPEGPRVLLLTDVFMHYFEPAIGHAMVRVLEALGCCVETTAPLSTGRAAISTGFLDEAKACATRRVRELDERVRAGWTLVGQEPSELLTLRDEWLDLVDAADLDAARRVAERAWLLEEYLAEHGAALETVCDGGGQPVHVHGHCHAKAATGMDPLLSVLRRAGYRPALLKAGCCGLAGGFGYREDNYRLSMDIGELALFPAVRRLAPDALLCAHGFSCRHQILDGTGRHARHPAELLAQACV